MIDVWTRLKDTSFKPVTSLVGKKDLFKEFDHYFGERKIHFDHSLYEDGIHWMTMNGMTLYSITEKDFSKMIRFIGLTVKEFITLVYKECALSVKFFMSEICRVPLVDGGFNSYILDVGKFAQLTAFENELNSLLCNPRQTGSTMFLCGLYNWIIMFRSYCSNIMIMDRSRPDYEMFMEKVAAVRKGIPHVFFHEEIRETYHYQNNRNFTNYLFVNEFEFLEDAQYQYFNTLYSLKSKTNMGIYPANIGFSTKTQLVANSTVNSKPSELLKNIIQNRYIGITEDFFDAPVDFMKNKASVVPSEYNSKIIEIRFDEIHIMSTDNLNKMKKLFETLPEAYDTEIRRLRTPINSGRGSANEGHSSN